MATTTSSLPRSIPRSPTTSLCRNPAAPWRHVDVILVSCLVAVASLGVLMVYSATRGPGGDQPLDDTFLTRQAVFVLAGFAVMFAVSLIDYRNFREWAIVIYGGFVLLLVLVVSPLGSEKKGAQAWFQLGSFQLQPSEFAKLAVIIGLSALAAQFQGEIDLRRLATCMVVAGIPLTLIMVQPDLGTGLVLAVISAGILLLAGARPRHMAAMGLCSVLGAGLLLNSNVLEEYQKARLTSFLDPAAELQTEAYNRNQSIIAIGAGSWFGAGLFEGTQTRLRNVPEQHTDFIFTAVGEELGFVGAGTLLALFGIMCWRVWRTAQLARDSFGTLVCVGVLVMLLFQIFQNVGMTMGIMPITGIPLPFVSYGGSSVVTMFAGVGIVLNVHMRRFA
ncbi:rod shape-determining protein RodA [soil metagenome]